MTARLDHIVINARFAMDQAEDIFTRLGFTLTPRGRHSLGSINHLMMFGQDYLELIGIAESDAHKRPEVANAPLGLNGLVFKTDDVEQAYARLESLAMAGDPPKSFSRPVTLADGSTHDARFRTVTARADAFPAARLYFCEHLTPELLWREEWQSHANGVSGFSELVLVTTDVSGTAERLGELLGAPARRGENGGLSLALPGGFRLSMLSRADYRERFGEMAGSGEGREAFLGAVGLHCGDVENAARFARDAGARSARLSGSLLAAAIEPFDALLVFEAAAN